jgi:hypothetical protein
MKKLKLIAVTLFTLYSVVCVGQNTRDEYFNIVGKPTFTAPTIRAYSVDYTNKQVWRSTSKTTPQWTLETDQNIIDMYLGGKGEKGDTGAQGIQGVPGRDGVCPSCPPTSGGSFPYNIVIGTGNDAAAMNAAIAANVSNNKPIYLVGNVNTGIISVPKNAYRLTIIGYGSKWYGGLRRTTPTNNSDANEYIVARFVIEGIEFVGNQSIVALDLGPSYMSAYRDLKFDGFLEAIHLRFALRTLIENCEAVNCVNGFIADMGNWTGADNANSQSNHTTFTDCRAYMPSNGQVAYGIYAASGCVVRDCIIEGFVVTKGIDFNGRNSNVVKDFTIENVHFECVNGSSVAFINIESFAGGIITINKAFGQHASMFLNANSTSGLGFIDISYVPWWVAKNGKFFKTSNISLNFKYNEAFRGINSSMWEGTAPQQCGGSGCGYNRYTYTDIPR